MLRAEISAFFNRLAVDAAAGWRTFRSKSPSQIQFWLIALFVGIAGGFAAVGFRHGIDVIQRAAYGVDDPNLLHSFASHLAWWKVVLIPTLGGLVVGLILTRFTDDGRVRSVAEVIQGAAMREGRLNEKSGIASTLASLITLATGGSTGREGPVVHMAGIIASWVSNRIHANGITGRDLLGCAVAAAVSASFNAPIAGALFALEVVLRHFAVHAFAPIVIASVAGTVINRMDLGGAVEFDLTLLNPLVLYIELPAFLILGLLCGLVAVVLMRAIFLADDLGTTVVRRTGLPPLLRPALSGFLLGVLAIAFPHIIGVGYETTSRALMGQLLFWQAVLFCAVKVFAVALTYAGRMGGGVFSPALMIGALTGLAFGAIATSVFPEISGTRTLYAMAGMGAVAAAVLGAPISTTLIVFELTGDWQAGLAVMVAVSTSTALSTRLVHRSFFLTQLERRGIALAAGPQSYLLAMFRVASVMRTPDHPRAASEDRFWHAVDEGLTILPNATLKDAMPIFERTNTAFIPVLEPGKAGAPPKIHGALFQVDALKAYNRALAATAAEEHS